MTLLIKNVRVLGGAHDFPEEVDVFVSGEKISAIGHFPNKGTDEVVDGQGAYLSPGFIDVNTDSDHYLTLFDHPGQEDFLKQGVTTIMGGMCGSSLAPLIYGTLESVRKWGGSEDKINVDWHTMAEFLAAVNRRPLAVNFGTMAGHSTIRRAILGDTLRDLVRNELNVLSETLKRAIGEGAFGVSTGLGYVHGRKTPYTELRTLAEIVNGTKGVYATHLRKTGVGIRGSVDETIKLAKETGASVLINHFVPLRTSKEEYEKALEEIEKLSPECDFHFDLYPFDTMLLPIYTFLPIWAQTGGLEVMLASVKDEWLASRIKKDMPPIDEERFMIAQAPANDFLVGKSLKDIEGMYGLRDGRDALLKLMATVNLRGMILYENLDIRLMRRAIASKRSLIASNAPSFGDASTEKQLRSERTTSTFTKFLSLAENDKLLSLRGAIRKITFEPARKFGLTGRGEIKEGNVADLTCFKGSEIKCTIVNGKVVMKNGEFQNRFPGKALRHASRT